MEIFFHRKRQYPLKYKDIRFPGKLKACKVNLFQIGGGAELNPFSVVKLKIKKYENDIYILKKV